MEMEKRRQPSRGVVFSRSRMWKNEIGVLGGGIVTGRVVKLDNTDRPNGQLVAISNHWTRLRSSGVSTS